MTLLRTAQARQGHVRKVALAIRCKAYAHERRLDLALQMHQGLARAHARPECGRPLAAELAHTMQCERKGGRIDAKQRIVNGACLAPIHLADESQREMKLLARLPARAGNAH